MNTNSNSFIQKMFPYLFIILLAYFISTIIFIFLPKTGVEFVDGLNNEISYEKYDGFYSKVTVVKTPKIDKKLKKRDVETLSKYVLKAVYSTTSNGGWITVEEKGSKKSTILEQYEKFNGYTLVKLFKTYAIFEKNLKEYKLELPKEKEINYKIERKNTHGNFENIIVNEDNVTVKRNYLNSYINNLDKVWKDIAIKDIRKNGKIDGFKVDRVAENSIFKKLGLKQKDIIKSINGKVIKSYADVFKIYNEINKLDYLTFEVLRNNELMELNYEID